MGNNEIVKKSEWLSKEEKQVINRQFFPQGADDADKIYCMKVAEAFNLNPILKQIYFVPRKVNIGTYQNPNWVEKVEPLAGRDSFLTLAHRTGKFDGIESKVEIKDTPVLKDGKWIRENDLVATATVYKKGSDRPFIVSVNYREYAQKKKNGDVTQFWADKPETMLKKVAESQVLRKAFDITGLYAEEEYEEKYINNDYKAKTNTQTQQHTDLNSIAYADKTIDIDFEQIKQPTPKEKMINELTIRGATQEQAGVWCYGKSDEFLNSYLNDPATIDDALADAVGA